MTIIHRRAFVVAILTAVLVMGVPSTVWGQTIDELRQELTRKREVLKEAQERIAEFAQDLQTKKREARTLESQIGLLDDNIDQLTLSIESTRAELGATEAEIAAVVKEITEKEAEIAIEKDLLAEYLRTLHSLDQQSTVSVLLKYATFSEVVSETATFAELSERTQRTLIAIQLLRDELAAKRRDLEDFKQTLEALRLRQEGEQNLLASQRNSKQRLLTLTHAQEQQFQSLIKQSQAAHQEAQAEISRIDTLIREELRKQGIGNLPSVGAFDYPIPILYGTSCEFQCSGYPYEYLIGKHTGIDWPASPGTPITAPAEGYVARAHDAGGSGYSYILLIHGDGLSTVFGHVSGFAANEGELVPRGAVIGYTGGVPGARGAGLSSGPHLHFEVRKNNVPVNPRNYL